MPGRGDLSDEARIAELLGLPPDRLPVERSENTVDMDRFDRRTYDETLRAAPNLRDLGKQGPATWPALLRDVWSTYYKPAPELRDEQAIDPAHRVNRPFTEKLMDDPATKATRLTTQLDDLSAAVATMAAGERLLQEVQERPELRDVMEQAVDGAVQDEIDKQATKARRKLDAAAQSVRQAVRAAAGAGQEKAAEVQSALAGWGLDPADLAVAPLGERLNLVERLLNPRLKQLADMVGRMRNLARARQKAKVKHARDEVYSITLGADLAHVLPVELASIRHPLRRLDFFRRYTEHQVLQYELRGREPLGRGPIICLVDVSGSMGGQSLDWAVATSLALVDTASRQKRRAAVLFFNTQVLREFEFEPGERDIEKYLAMASVSASGGTNYVEPIDRATKLAVSSPYQQADIVMVTDGVCRLPDDRAADLVAWKREEGARIWSVLIGNDPYGELAKWSDRVWEVSRLTDDVAGDLSEEVT